ncbi:MAG TPA: sulfite oxidase [Terriglobales bacterium]|nr:sulfite oxidase [Terriglobales bacterium]
MSTRREFLQITTKSAFAGIALSNFSSVLMAQASTGRPGEMIIRSERYLDLETPPERLQTWITPIEHFFVRNHMAEPYAFDLGEWRLKVTGEVEHPLELSYTELQRMELATVANTLECAGNGRSFYQPHVPGIQWARGAVGTARFHGPRMREVLGRAAVKSSGKHVAFFGLDEPPGKVPKFARSIPIEKAMDADTLLATQMNGLPLSKPHGYPMRALVPGWIGSASVKWLAEMRVLPEEFAGNFMNPGYRLPNQPVAPGGEIDPKETHAITALGVKSIITAPEDGSDFGLVHRTSHRSQVPEHGVARLTIQGAAWAGEYDVSKVEVSTDEGKTWHTARMHAEQAKYCWRLWNFSWTPPEPGDYVLMSRATDSAGHLQPMEQSWNPSGYLWNAVDRVRLHVT